jgi:hypothetical protein
VIVRAVQLMLIVRIFVIQKRFDMDVLHTAHVQPAVLSCSETPIVLW